ncbi:MAG TPA: hypothetical protein VGX48_25160 [Pyrinomonadaceae bacterium]|nr:hypothetical protein [Pyrinomonadaceae bacterium]
MSLTGGERFDSEGEKIELALGLAFFIHGRDDVAYDVALAALSKLGVTSKAQDRRVDYYRPVNRHRKIILEELHLLQLLVYIESGRLERKQEGSGGLALLGKEDLLVRYLEHLTKVTLGANILRVTVGLCYFVYAFEVAQVRKIYLTLTQAEFEEIDGTRFRKCKSSLMKDIKERFGDLLPTQSGRRHRLTFVREDDPQRYSALFADCLKAFTPWGTPCLSPDPDGMRAALRDKRADSAKNYLTDAVRLHAAFHQSCFSKLVASLGLRPPEDKLMVPKFAFPINDDSPQDQRGPRPFRKEPSGEEVEEVRGRLREQSSRRRDVTASAMSVVIDGVERAVFDPRDRDGVRVEAEGGAELLEVRRRDDGLLLAVCVLLGHDPEDRETQTSVTQLEGGQSIKFDVTAHADESAPRTNLSVMVSYRRAHARVARAAASPDTA